MKIDITNNKYGRLTAIKETSEYLGESRKWVCLCVCGKKVKVSKNSLMSGNTKSCGCLRMDAITKHGMYGTSVYRSWFALIQRCNNKNSTPYPYYGGRGISVCERWVNSFEDFYKDMGDKPSKNHSIDRIDNDGDYCPENCRWATNKQQSRNKRNNVMVEFKGKEQCITDWSIETGINKDTLKSRIDSGWTIEKSLTKSVAIQK